MARHAVLRSILALVAAGHVAVAQTLTPAKAITPIVPLATTSFTPYVASGTLGGASIELGLDGVTFNSSARFDGAIILSPYYKSTAYLNSPVALPSGSYSVQFVFSRVAPQPATFTITRPAGTVIASCSLPASSGTQTCDSGVFSISDGKLGLALAITQGAQATLAKVVVNHLR